MNTPDDLSRFHAAMWAARVFRSQSTHNPKLRVFWLRQALTEYRHARMARSRLRGDHTCA